MIIKGATGFGAGLPFSLINSTTGAGTAGHSWNDIGGGITDELEVILVDGSSHAVVIANITEIGDGDYEYRIASSTPTSSEGKIYYRPQVSGHEETRRWEDVVDPFKYLFATTVESGAMSGAQTFIQQFRIMFAILAGKAPSDLNASPYYFRNNPGGTDTKDRAAFTMSGGVRTPTDLDGDL